MLSVLVLVSYKLKLSCVCVCVLHVEDFLVYLQCFFELHIWLP